MANFIQEASKKDYSAPTAYLNFYLPSSTADSGRRKLGTIRLYNEKAHEDTLIAWLKEDPSRVGQVLAQLQIDFKMADGTSTAGFDLVAPPAAVANG